MSGALFGAAGSHSAITEVHTAPLFRKPGYGDSERCQWRSLQSRMCKKSVLQNGKLISRACSCFPGESSYNLRKGECPQTYSNGARALAILGSGLAERDKRDKRGSSCPGLRWAGSLTCAWKRELESMIIRTHTIIFPPLLHFVFKRRCAVGEGFPCAQVCVQWERPGTASRH